MKTASSILNCRRAEPSLGNINPRKSSFFPIFKANSSTVKALRAVRLKDEAFLLHYITSPSWLVLACSSILWRRGCLEGWKSAFLVLSSQLPNSWCHLWQPHCSPAHSTKQLSAKSTQAISSCGTRLWSLRVYSFQYSPDFILVA